MYLLRRSRMFLTCSTPFHFCILVYCSLLSPEFLRGFLLFWTPVAFPARQERNSAHVCICVYISETGRYIICVSHHILR
jgi:hypothetical protein